MSRQWKPGDVAMVGTDDGEVAAVLDLNDDWVVIGPPHGPNELGWLDHRQNATPRRRLAVIDPEDAEQVERLAKAWDDVIRTDLDNAAPMTLRGLRMRTALRSMIEPPKPKEPTGLGAVVFARCECEPERKRFVRDDISDEFPCDPWKANCGHHVWVDLDVRDSNDVLSEGVTA